MKKIKVLLFKDYNENILAYQKYDYVICSSSKEISQFISSKKFDIIIIDLLNNSEELNLLSSSILSKNIPILYISSANNEDRVIKALNIGVSNFIIRDNNNRYLKLLDPLIEKTITNNNKQVDIFNKAVEFSPSITVITDVNGNIEYVNPKFCEITGYTKDEAIGKKPNILKSGKQSTDFYKKLWGKINSGNDWKGEFHNRKKNGEFYWESASISAILDKYGNITHFIKVAEDITEKKAVSEKLKKAIKNAETANKAKSAFLANMSHELRTPMTAIIGLSDMLTKEDDYNSNMNKDQIESISIINQSAKRLLSLINDILDISKVEAGKMEVNLELFSLNALLSVLESSIRTLIVNKDLVFEIKKDKKVPEVIMSDSKKLIQILYNLLGNSAKFTERGKIVLSIYKKKQNLYFEVSDTGIGISKENIKLIFDDFTQLDNGMDRKYNGTGLGLSLSKKLVKLLNGEIEIESELRKGTRIKFFIPLNPKSMEKSIIINQEKTSDINLRETKSDTIKNSLTKSMQLNKKILIADDAPENIFTLKMILKKGYNIITASNGKEAVEKYFSEQPDIVLMDVMMPIMNGIEAFQKIRESSNNMTPILAITAHAMQKEKDEILSFGFDGYISKPFDEDLLMNTIEEMLNKSR